MATDAELFLKHVQRTFGDEDEILRIPSTKPGLPAVAVFVYRDVPEDGLLTAVTYGLSAANHPAWVVGRPELLLTIDSNDEAWPNALGWFADAFRADHPFAYGSCVTTDGALAGDTEMTGFFFFGPAVKVEQRVELATKVVNLIGAYPIHKGEVALLRAMGLEKFWDRLGDIFDPRRPDTSSS